MLHASGNLRGAHQPYAAAPEQRDVFGEQRRNWVTVETPVGGTLSGAMGPRRFNPSEMLPMEPPMATTSDGAVGVVVLDPKSHVLCIPADHILETLAIKAPRRALDECGNPSLPSLCQLFLAHHCRFGPQCRQVHADLGIVSKLRAEWAAEQARPRCCMRHAPSPAEAAGLSLLSAWLRDRSASGEWKKAPEHPAALALRIRLGEHVGGEHSDDLNGVNVPATQFSITRGLQTAIAMSKPISTLEETSSTSHETRRVLDSSVPLCKNHGPGNGGRCRFDSECKFLHVCKELLHKHINTRVQHAVEEEANSFESRSTLDESNDDRTSPNVADPLNGNECDRVDGAQRTLTPDGHVGIMSDVDVLLNELPQTARRNRELDSPGKCLRKLSNGSFGWAHDPYAATSPTSNAIQAV